MVRRTRAFVTMAAAGGTSLLAPARALVQASASAATGPQIGYAPVNGLRMYYEIHGHGEPLVLLHGAFGTIDEWGPILTTLAARRRVVAVELQGHGHTADSVRPFAYEHLADDVAALLDHLDIDRADVVGYSMGGNTALQVAIQHPEKVRKLVAISATYRSDGEYPEVRAGIRALTPALFAGTPIEASYRRNAPNPDAFPVLVERIKAFLTTEFAWPEADLRSIAAPTLLLVGDADTVRPEHALEMFRLLGGGVPGDLTGLPTSHLAILPGTTHASIVAERTDLLLARIETFLAAQMPETA